MKKIIIILCFFICFGFLTSCKKSVDKLNEEELLVYNYLINTIKDGEFDKPETIVIESIGKYETVSIGTSSVRWLPIEMKYRNSNNTLEEGKFLIICTAVTSFNIDIYSYETGSYLLKSTINVDLGEYQSYDYNIKNISKALKDYLKG